MARLGALPRFPHARRALVGVLAAVAILALALGSWAAFWTAWNPAVAVPAPRVLRLPRSRPTIQVVAAGDFAPTDAALPYVRRHGWRYPYEPTAKILQAADVAFANLEAPVTRSTDPFPWPKKYLYRVDPAALATLRWVGLDVVSAANNHVADYRDRGVVDTVRLLRRAGIEPIGAGEREAEARRGVVFDVGGTRLGFLAYLEDSPEYNLYFRTFATGDRVGCARLLPADVREDVRRLRRHADLVFASVHWGANYRPVRASQEKGARVLAEAGVDVVLGHHAHDVQEVGRIGDTLVFYSLGNWAWGAIGNAKLRVGLLARLTIAPREGDRRARLVGAEVLPIVTQNRIVRYRPRRLRRSELAWLDPFLAGTRARGVGATVDGTRVVLDVSGAGN